MSFVFFGYWSTTKTTIHLMRSERFQSIMCLLGSGGSPYLFHSGVLCRAKSIYSGCTPCTLAAKVLPKGIILANGFAFTGSRGTGSRCQLNRGINPGPLYSSDPFGSVFRRVPSYHRCSQAPDTSASSEGWQVHPVYPVGVIE